MTAHAGTSLETSEDHAEPVTGTAASLLRVFALAMVTAAFSYLVNNWLTFWRDWPGVSQIFIRPENLFAWTQFAIYLIPFMLVAIFVYRSAERGLLQEAKMLSRLTNYIIRGAFWAVLMVGLVDMVISFLRVEGLLVHYAGEQLGTDLGRSQFRGSYIHYPLIALGFIIALFTRTLGFYWLALLVVLAEIQIVLSRFIFSYEQAFMADLVRFWYGALFLFASAYTLSQDGHVRVDLLYASFSKRGKAWTNVLGSLLLGLPLCWIIIAMGMWGKFNIINGPLINFEVSQAGYGLYVKYLLAGFLLVYALSMMTQFMSYLLSNADVLLQNKNHRPDISEQRIENG